MLVIRRERQLPQEIKFPHLAITFFKEKLNCWLIRASNSEFPTDLTWAGDFEIKEENHNILNSSIALQGSIWEVTSSYLVSVSFWSWGWCWSSRAVAPSCASEGTDLHCEILLNEWGRLHGKPSQRETIWICPRQRKLVFTKNAPWRGSISRHYSSSTSQLQPRAAQQRRNDYFH